MVGIGQLGDLEFYAAVRQSMAGRRGPVGVRLRNAIADLLETGRFASGHMLPPERQMAEHLDVSRSTLRSGLQELARLGLVLIHPGAGTEVVAQIPKALSRLSGFTEDMQRQGLSPRSEVVERTVAEIGLETAFRTGIPLGTVVMTLVRRRLAGDEILSFERAIVPLSAVGKDYDGTSSLFECMDANDARPRRIMQSMKAIAATKEIASQLRIRTGAPLLEISQLGYDERGSVVQDATSWYRGDRYTYVGELRG